MVKKVMNPDSSKVSGSDFIPVVVQRQCHAQCFLDIPVHVLGPEL